MFLARVLGAVVATKKDEAMKGHRLLILRPMLVDQADPPSLKAGSNTVIAVDTVGAGKGDMVLFCQGSSARQATGLKTLPVDTAVIGLVDHVEALGHTLYANDQG